MADKCRRISQGAVGGVSLQECLCIRCECALMISDCYLHLQRGTDSCCRPCFLSISQPRYGSAVTPRHGGGRQFTETTLTICWINGVGRCSSLFSRKENMNTLEIKCHIHHPQLQPSAMMVFQMHWHNLQSCYAHCDVHTDILPIVLYEAYNNWMCDPMSFMNTIALLGLQFRWY